MGAVRKRNWTNAKGEAKTAWVVDFIDQSGQRQRRQFLTRREADAYRIECEARVRAGTFRDAGRLTVADLTDAYLAHCEERMTRGERMTRHNLAVYRGHVNNHILHPERGLGAVLLRRLTNGMICDFRDRIRDAGVSVVTCRKILGTLHGALEYAISRDVLGANPARGVRVLGARDEGARKITPPSKDAMRALIAAADDDFRVVLVFASATGLRAGELHALRWRHLDLDAGSVTVETRVDPYGEEGAPKTAAGVREVPIGAAVVALLKAWRLRSPFSQAGDLVFPGRRGGYEDHANMIKRHFKATCARAGVEGVNWHALRHFAVSCWIEAGLSPKTIQTYAGHSSLQVTMDRYGHLFKTDDHKRVMDQIARGLLQG